MKTHVTLQVALTEADISQNLTISIFLVQKIVCIHGKQLKKWSEVD